MPLKYELKTAMLSSNNEVGFDSDSITLIVGPNNSGKSCFLREISKIIEQGINTTASIVDRANNPQGNRAALLRPVTLRFYTTVNNALHVN